MVGLIASFLHCNSNYHYVNFVLALCVQLKLQLSIAHQDAKLKAQKAEEILIDRDAFWEQKVQVANMQAKLEERQRKIEQLEQQKRAWTEAKSEHELTKTKLSNLEEKLSRQDQQQLQIKKKALADSTSFASNPNITAPTAKQAIKGLSSTGSSFAGNVSRAPAAMAVAELL